MKFAFRVDSSTKMGTGHLIRCLTLARALRAMGGQCHFITRNHIGHVTHLVAENGFPATLLPAAVEVPYQDLYQEWLVVSVEQDRAETHKVLTEYRPDWLVVDHYGLDHIWESHHRDVVGKLMVMDDLMSRHHDCDLLLNQNFSDRPSPYEGRVPAACRLLLGPHYALIREEFFQYRQTLIPRDDQRALVFLGGSDHLGLNQLVLEALSDESFKGWQIDMVLGANVPDRTKLVEMSAKLTHVKLHAPRPHLADLMAQASIAIGAGGGTTWERMALGLPSIVFCVADNQKAACEALDRTDEIRFVKNKVELLTAWRQLVQDSKLRAKLARSNEKMVDGLGAQRVALTLISPQSKDLWVKSSLSTTEKKFTATVMAENVPYATLEVDTAPSMRDLRFDGMLGTTTWRQEAILQAHTLWLQMRRSFLATNNFLKTKTSSGKRMAILSDSDSWLNGYITELMQEWLGEGHSVLWVHHVDELQPGDICFYLGCGQIVPSKTLALFKNNLVVHESALPAGKGWSPLTWQVLEGKRVIPVTLFEAQEKVDSGVIYSQVDIHLRGGELVNELRSEQAKATLLLCRNFVAHYPQSIDQKRSQQGTESFYARRTPKDSELNVTRTLEQCFPLFQVADNDRYPVYFHHQGQKYHLRVTKAETQNE